MAYPSSLDTFAGTAAQGTNLLTSPDHGADHRTLGSALGTVEQVIGTTAGTSIAKNFAAGDFAARINSGGTVQQSLTGTINANTLLTYPANATPTANNIPVLDANALLPVAALPFAVVPAVRVYNNAVQSINNNNPTSVTFNSETFDTDTMHSTSSNTDRLIATHAGLYLVTAQVCFASNATGRRQIFIARSAGTSLAGVEVAPTLGAGATICQFSTLLQMAANDYVSLTVYQTSGGALNCGDGSDSYAGTHLEMIKISA